LSEAAPDDLPNRVQYLNTLRGIAALLVVFAHYFWVFFGPNLAGALRVPAPSFAAPAWLPWLFQHPVKFGHFGVALFFLISGFVIPMSLSRQSGLAFLVARVLRIWPTYAVAFSLSLTALGILYWWLGMRWPFTALDALVGYFIILRDLVGGPNLDGIVWTLEVEAKFYVLCALTAPLFRRRSRLVFLLPAALAVVNVAIVSNGDRIAGTVFSEAARAAVISIPYLVYMFIGTAFYYLHAKRLSPNEAIFIIAAFYLLQIVSVLSGPISVRIGEYWNYGYALVLFTFASAYPRLFRGRRVTNFSASISYPLYAVHNIVGYAIFRVLIDLGAPVELTLTGMVVVAISLAWLLHVVVEKPTQRFGRSASLAIDQAKDR
jgi:peptidoglycan/LPS O-acetylase OafA/YrhL